MGQIIPRKLLHFFSRGLFIVSILTYSLSYSQSTADSINVLHYDIFLDKVDIPARTIQGHTLITVTSIQKVINQLHFDLLKLTVDSVFVGGETQTFDYNDTIIILNLKAPLTSSDTLKINIYYHGTPHVEQSGWGGFHFSEDRMAYNLGIALDEIPHNFGKVWFACRDNFNDRATYDFYIRLDTLLFAVCNGVLISSNPGPQGFKTYHWKLADEIPTYLASVAISNYVPIHGIFHGYARDIPTDIYVNSSDTANARKSFFNLNKVLATFENRFGSYHWSRIGFVSTTIGAMEHATNIAYPTISFNGKLDDEYLYAHELSHSWFGNLVTCKSPADMWINEGWAVFCESIALDGIYGLNAYKNNIRKKHLEVLQRTYITDAGYRPVYGIPEKYTYGSTVYDKGGMVVHTLRGYLGDSIFFNTVKTMLDSFAFQNISTVQMRDFFNRHSRIKVTDFFDTWVFSPGFPHYAIDSFHVTPVGSAFAVTVFIRQQTVGGLQAANSNRIEIGLLGKEWQYSKQVLKFSGQLGNQTFTLPFVPLFVMADPDEKSADATIDYGVAINSIGKLNFPETYFTLTTLQVKDSAFVRVIYNYIAPDPLSPSIEGLTISTSSYWKIEGLFPPGFQANGDFYYSLLNNLDNVIIHDKYDSLILVYRPDTKSQWQGISFLQTGNGQQGSFQIEPVLPGEYTIAVWDSRYRGKHNLLQQNKQFRNKHR